MRGARNCFDPLALHAMIFTYLDDSADKRREKYFAAGGLIGGDQWATFDLRWLDETRELEKPFRSTTARRSMVNSQSGQNQSAMT